MTKHNLYIAEKPSVAQEFAKALKLHTARKNGYLESDEAVVTWCVGHLVTMSYPEAYDPELKRWSLETLPFLPAEFKYEVIGSVAQQFQTVRTLLTRPDVDTIYVCTDSGREGEYIYRLVEQMSGPQVRQKRRRRVWIDSQTEEEIQKGIREARELSDYDNLAASAYLRAKEDYLMGINFSRLLTLKYGNTISSLLKTKRTVLSVGRVMTCVLGMVVRREREIRSFVKTPFYRVLVQLKLRQGEETALVRAEWKAVPGSRYDQSPCLYRDNGFRERETAEALAAELRALVPQLAEVVRLEKKTEKKNPPLLFNLAELQNICSKTLKLTPDETLKVVQELYEKKLVTYPRTDARVLSTAIAKEIGKNLGGLREIPGVRPFVETILSEGRHRGIAKSRYTNDKQITDHYAIIPTGQGIRTLEKLPPTQVRVYELIVRRFLSIFYPPAVYKRYQLEVQLGGEHFFASFKALEDPGYLQVTGQGSAKKETEAEGAEQEFSASTLALLARLKKGSQLPVSELSVKEGETSPPKRYTSGSMILAMENAGQLIEDEELRAQIKGSGIGTSATRAEILKKLVTIQYLSLAKKTQVITPTLLGELVFDTVDSSLRPLLNPELTASWEKGLTLVAEGSITEQEYMQKLEQFIIRRTQAVLGVNNSRYLWESYGAIAPLYQK